MERLNMPMIQKVFTLKFFAMSMIAVSAFVFVSCCSLAITSETTFYRGWLGMKIADTSGIDIYGDNLFNGGVLINGTVPAYLKPQHPDTNGYFLVTGTTPSHTECTNEDHWDNGPYVIYVTGANIKDYHDTISVAVLKTLPKLSADSLGVNLGSQGIGVWELPEITLQSK